MVNVNPSSVPSVTAATRPSNYQNYPSILPSVMSGFDIIDLPFNESISIPSALPSYVSHVEMPLNVPTFQPLSASFMLDFTGDDLTNDIAAGLTSVIYDTLSFIYTTELPTDVNVISLNVTALPFFTQKREYYYNKEASLRGRVLIDNASASYVVTVLGQSSNVENFEKIIIQYTDRYKFMIKDAVNSGHSYLNDVFIRETNSSANEYKPSVLPSFIVSNSYHHSALPSIISSNSWQPSSRDTLPSGVLSAIVGAASAGAAAVRIRTIINLILFVNIVLYLTPVCV